MVTQDLARELPKQQSSMERQLKAGRIVMKTCARCAKAAMMGLVYTHWYGMYGVTHRFYMEFVPQLGELIDHNRSGSKASAATWLGNKLGEVLNSEMHRRFLGKSDPGELAACDTAAAEFKKRYAQ